MKFPQMSLERLQVKTAPGPHTSWGSVLCECDKSKKACLDLVRSTKVICSLDLVLQIFGEKCRHPSCSLETSSEYTLIGTGVIIKWTCPKGHAGTFHSSYNSNGILSTNLQTASAILYSGNNYSKMELFARFLGLYFISKSTFFRFQRLYCLSVINDWWIWQQNVIVSELRGKQLVVCGDGQCDSPGHSAKTLCYFLMEMATDYIVEVEVLDKRQ